jgi:hypothetical protein
MTHLKEEDMARMVQGNIGRKERKKFLAHMAECDSCSKIFSETLKFFEEEERMEERPVAAPAIPRYRLVLEFLFRKPVLVPAFGAALVVLIVFLVPLIFNNGSYTDTQVQDITDRFLSPKSIYSFNGSPDKIFSAVRAGIFIEVLPVLKDTAKTKEQEEAAGKISGKLVIQLGNIAKVEVDRLFPDPKDVGRIEEAVKKVETFMERHTLSGPFRFGRFLERSVFDTFKEKRPDRADIDTFRQMSRELDLPPGVFKGLDKLETTTAYDEIRNICKDIEKLFFL